jgi:hypothetical protein
MSERKKRKKRVGLWKGHRFAQDELRVCGGAPCERAVSCEPLKGCAAVENGKEAVVFSSSSFYLDRIAIFLRTTGDVEEVEGRHERLMSTEGEPYTPLLGRSRRCSSRGGEASQLCVSRLCAAKRKRKRVPTPAKEEQPRRRGCEKGNEGNKCGGRQGFRERLRRGCTG